MAPKAAQKGAKRKATGKNSITGHFQSTGAAATATESQQQEESATAAQDRAADAAAESQSKKARTEPKEGAGAIAATRKSPRKQAAAAAVVDMTAEADVDMTAAVAATAAAAGAAGAAAAAGDPATVTAMETLIKQAVAAAKAGAKGAANRVNWAVFFHDAQLAALVDQPKDPLAILSMSSTNGNCFYRVCALASGQPMTKVKTAIKEAGAEALRVGTDATLIDCVRQIILGTQPPAGAMEALKLEPASTVIPKFTAAVDKAEKTVAFYAGSNEAALLAHHADFKHIQLLSFKWPAAAPAQFTMYGARSRGVQTTAVVSVLLAHMDQHYGLLMERGENGVVNWKFNEEQLGRVGKMIGIAVPEPLVGDKVDLSEEGQQSPVAAAAAAAGAAGPPQSPPADAAEEVDAAEGGDVEQQGVQGADEKSDEDAAAAAAVPPNGAAAAAAAPGESALVVAAAGPAELPPAHKKLVFHNTVSSCNTRESAACCFSLVVHTQLIGRLFVFFCWALSRSRTATWPCGLLWLWQAASLSRSTMSVRLLLTPSWSIETSRRSV